MTDSNFVSRGTGNSLSSGTADSTNDLDPAPTAEELDIIGYFARGEKHSAASENLKLEFTETSIRLSDGNSKLIGISKQVNQWQRKVLIGNNSLFRARIVRNLTALGFITRQKSSHPEFTEYHHFKIPDGYHLNYTEVIQLWRIWWNNKRYQLNNPNPPVNILTFSKGKWYLVEDLQPKQGNFTIRIARGEITIEPEEYVVWLDLPTPTQDDPPESRDNNVSDSATFPMSESSSSELSSRPQPRQSTPVATPVSQESAEAIEDSSIEIDLESYLNTFNTEDTEDVDRIEGIYNISELLSGTNVLENLTVPSPVESEPAPIETTPPALTSVAVPIETTPPTLTSAVAPVQVPTKTKELVVNPTPTAPPLSISERQVSLKLKAMQVLATYLQDGERIVRTEVLKNAQGQEIDRKVTKIQRGCPSWAIDRVWQMTSIDS
ncbi:hypothetical protein [Chamaesiphon minutus]|uniref:Uncharacterized protein n=1 Tax=Chamaesiphon minutus (strain ATCC 27169 / PCC 6605) TaxID=1173020 RepID=K9UMR8_CHAP6|nr:hypothetical protein [Chamaesiphon minutus]AFY95731.1 hypothetical protein Cha6605_4818 [Chamaesiphon minutus PCC 6605]